MNHTEHQTAAEALAATTARLDALIASAMDAIISIDGNQRIVLFNPAAERMFGIPARQALGENISRFLPEHARAAHARHVEHFGKTGATARRMGALGEISGLRANGEEFPIEASISRVEVNDGTLFTVILRDITERKQVEAKLQAYADILEKTVAERTADLRQKIAELESFSYTLSHDLRAPLRAIQSFAGIALKEFGEKAGPASADLLQRVVRAAGRMDALIQDVLALSHLSRDQVTVAPVDVEKLLREIILERPELQPSRAEIDIQAPLFPVLGHEASLTQCLTNLLSNAAKFVAPGVRPHIRIWTETVQNRKPTATGDPQIAPSTIVARSTSASSVRLWIADNGIGIPAEMHARIFEIFQRLPQSTKYDGTGIGLAIVRKAVDRMGGMVGVDSESETGSRFWIELPGV
jgi:PAS domain S-box-containing protein